MAHEPKSACPECAKSFAPGVTPRGLFKRTCPHCGARLRPKPMLVEILISGSLLIGVAELVPLLLRSASAVALALGGVIVSNLVFAELASRVFDRWRRWTKATPVPWHRAAGSVLPWVLAGMACGLGGIRIQLALQHLVAEHNSAELERSWQRLGTAFRQGTCSGLRIASEEGEALLEWKPMLQSWFTDDDPKPLHRLLALVDAERWGECGDPVEEQARLHLAAGRSLDGPRSNTTSISGEWRAAALLQFFGGQPQDALDRLGRAVTEELLEDELVDAPAIARSRVLGTLQLHAGRWEEGWSHLDYRREQDARSLRSNLARGHLLRHLGRKEEAARLYDEVLQSVKDHPGALLGKLWLAVEARDWDAAEFAATPLLALAPETDRRRIAAGHALRAVVLDARGQPDEAQQERATALALQTPSAELSLALAWPLLSSGKVQEAARILRDAPVPEWQRPALERELRR
ncbi:MAG: hypothetical protein QM765_31765 [Myxococcales bacterium]